VYVSFDGITEEIGPLHPKQPIWIPRWSSSAAAVILLVVIMDPQNLEVVGIV
jgi:hypothetical protein